METCKFRLQACPNKERGCKVTLPAKVDFCQCSPHSALHINSQSPHIKPCLQDICWHMKQCSLNGGQPPPPIRKLSIPKNTERRHSIKGSANSLKVQLKEAEERRLSRSSSKSPGVRAQESPIHFAQTETTPNQDNKPPEVKTQDSQPVSVADVADPKTPELEIPETSNPEVQGAKSVSSVEDMNGDNDGCGDKVTLKEVDVQVKVNNPKPKPRRKPQ